MPEANERLYRIAHPAVRSLLPPRPNGLEVTSQQVSLWIRRGLRAKDGSGQVHLRASKQGENCQWMLRLSDLREFLMQVGLDKGESETPNLSPNQLCTQ